MGAVKNSEKKLSAIDETLKDGAIDISVFLRSGSSFGMIEKATLGEMSFW